MVHRSSHTRQYMINGQVLVCPNTNTLQGLNGSLKVKVEPRLIRLLGKLSSQPDHAFQRGDLIDGLWSNGQLSDEGLTLAISRLRKIFRQHFALCDVIQTVPRYGYRLTADVEFINQDPLAGTPDRRPLMVAVILTLLVATVSLWRLISPLEDDQVLLKKITHLENSYPSWSPDGKHLAIQSNREDHDSEIFLIRDNGEPVKRLTYNQGLDEYPSISPDGRHIAYSSSIDGNREIYVMKIDGTNHSNISNHPSRDILPRWHPNGQSIIFNSDREGNLDLMEYHLINGETHQLTHSPWDEKYASWSPDGRHLLFVRSRDERNTHIIKLALEHNVERQLTNGRSYNSWPTWSSAGDRIYFASNRNSKTYQIFMMDTDGENLRQLTFGDPEKASFTKPIEAPDGTGRLACTRTREGNVEVFIIHQVESNHQAMVYQMITGGPALKASF